VYTRTVYIKQANGREARVYLIRCFNENEEFYKIGKTFLELTTRFTKSNLCYDYEEIHSIYGEAGYVYDLEVELQRKYKSYKYKPKEWFAGHTECFNMELPINKITNFNNI
jgi:mannose/fructose/N-acetylgalactosamine-specific phosphotransferase system component IID